MIDLTNPSNDELVTHSLCRVCGETFEDETHNLHEECGQCEELVDPACARCGDGPSASYGDTVPEGHVDLICAACVKERERV